MQFCQLWCAMPCCMAIHINCRRRMKHVGAVTDFSLQDCVDYYQTLLEINLAFTSRKISWQSRLEDLYCIIWVFKFRLKMLTVKSRMYYISCNDLCNCSKPLFIIKYHSFRTDVCVCVCV